MRPAAILAFGVALAASAARGQKLDPVQWTLSSGAGQAPAGSTISLHLTAKIDEGWHLYSLTTPAGGPIRTTAELAENPAVVRATFYQPPPVRKLDPNFKIDTETFEKQLDLPVKAELAPIAAGSVELAAQVRYQVCNDRQCLPPRKKTASYTLTITPAAPAPAAFTVPANFTELKPGAVAVATVGAPSSPAQADGMGAFLLAAFGFGLAAIFTPCVFPMIPITVSFFLNQRGGILQAVVFSLGIVVLFCLLGLGVSAAVGPFGVVQLGSNPWVNGFIALVFGIFALSLLEIGRAHV